MNPIYEKDDGRWYFEVFGQEYGPYDDEDVATDNYTALWNGCPNCNGD